MRPEPLAPDLAAALVGISDFSTLLAAVAVPWQADREHRLHLARSGQGAKDTSTAWSWTRPALSRRDRRFVTLACVAAADADAPLPDHFYAALNNSDLSITEMREVVLHFAVYASRRRHVSTACFPVCPAGMLSPDSPARTGGGPL